MKIYYVDGQFVPSDQAVIPVDDLAILRGYGICDIMRTYKGQPYFLNEHVRRLEDSARETGIDLPWDSDELKTIILQTLEKNPAIEDANIRIIVTGGSSSDFFTPQGEPRLIVMVTPIPALPPQWYTHGIHVVTHHQERALPKAKVISYMSAAMALKEAKKSGAIEALYITREGEALEGTTSNLFAFFNNILVTPGDKVLKGITRKLILSLGKKIFKVEERPIPLEDLLQADEVFISGTNKGIVPVVQIDSTPVGRGIPGKNTQKLMALLQEHAQDFMISQDPS
ncbi:MAG: aminotransferase class IV [Desulfobacterales bacterium]|nr:aminotransferase class IV [Desulfobacterales bacterium]